MLGLFAFRVGSFHLWVMRIFFLEFGGEISILGAGGSPSLKVLHPEESSANMSFIYLKTPQNVVGCICSSVGHFQDTQFLW